MKYLHYSIFSKYYKNIIDIEKKKNVINLMHTTGSDSEEEPEGKCLI